MPQPIKIVVSVASQFGKFSGSCEYVTEHIAADGEVVLARVPARC